MQDPSSAQYTAVHSLAGCWLGESLAMCTHTYLGSENADESAARDLSLYVCFVT